MCEMCKIQSGDSEIIESNTVAIKIGNRVMTEHELGVAIFRDSDGSYYLDTCYFMDGGDPTAMVRIPISYCPFCGEHLPGHTKKDYPWTNK